MRRTVLASATKFWPRARLGCSPLATSSSWISAGPWVTRSVWHPGPTLPRPDAGTSPPDGPGRSPAQPGVDDTLGQGGQQGEGGRRQVDGPGRVGLPVVDDAGHRGPVGRVGHLHHGAEGQPRAGAPPGRVVVVGDLPGRPTEEVAATGAVVVVVVVVVGGAVVVVGGGAVVVGAAASTGAAAMATGAAVAAAGRAGVRWDGARWVTTRRAGRAGGRPQVPRWPPTGRSGRPMRPRRRHRAGRPAARRAGRHRVRARTVPVGPDPMGSSGLHSLWDASLPRQSVGPGPQRSDPPRTGMDRGDPSEPIPRKAAPTTALSTQCKTTAVMRPLARG